MEYLTLKYIKVNQSIGSFFLCKLAPKHLRHISNDNLSRYNDSENGIQRNISASRKKEIHQYIYNDEEATFPNTIIIAVNNLPGDSKASYILDEETCTIKILYEDGVANILDGQHRLSGFDVDDEKFELPVSVFLDIPLNIQATIFAKINSTHTRVSLDLVYELFGISEVRKTEKSAYSLVKELSINDDSPWKNKIKTLTERSGDMAQGSFAKYIDKELLSNGKILNNLYLQERDSDILQILINYFNAIKDTFPKEWNNVENKFILTKTTGFVGFMIFFKDLLKLSQLKNIDFTYEYCKSKIEKTKSNFLEFTSENYESGAKGQNKIRDILRANLNTEEKELLKLNI